MEELPQLLVIIEHEESAAIAPFELAFNCKLAYESPHALQLPGVVLRPRSAHSDPSEVKNIIVNLLHLCFFEAMSKRYPAIHHLYQRVKNEL
jgi:hypothetical protein